MSQKEDEAYSEGKERGYQEGYAEASKHFMKLGVFIALSLVLSYIIFKFTGCS